MGRFYYFILIVWNCFLAIMKGFLGNKKAEKYEVLILKLLHSYQELGYRMLFKTNFYPHFFPDNLGGVNEERGERIYQNVRTKKSTTEDNAIQLGWAIIAGSYKGRCITALRVKKVIKHICSSSSRRLKYCIRL